MISIIHHPIAEPQTPDPVAYSIAECCEALEVSRSGYYDHLAKPERPRNQQDEALADQIQTEFNASRKTYGARRIQRKLRSQGRRHSRRRISRLMARRRLKARQKGRYRPKTTDSRHGGPIAPNLLQSAPPPTRPNQVWVTDVTYIDTTAGWRYLSATLDLCTRKIVAWNLFDTLETSLCTTTLQLALEAERPNTHVLLLHSDRGVQYSSMEFRTLCALSRITQSMSRRGNCYDNAFMESFWATFKTEALPHKTIPTPDQLELLTFDYIHAFYNPFRLHSSLDYQSPLDFERNLNQSSIHNQN
jgi:transposase InsO family protein